MCGLGCRRGFQLGGGSIGEGTVFGIFLNIKILLSCLNIIVPGMNSFSSIVISTGATSAARHLHVIFESNESSVVYRTFTRSCCVSLDEVCLKIV